MRTILSVLRSLGLAIVCLNINIGVMMMLMRMCCVCVNVCGNASIPFRPSFDFVNRFHSYWDSFSLAPQSSLRMQTMQREYNKNVTVASSSPPSSLSSSSFFHCLHSACEYHFCIVLCVCVTNDEDVELNHFALWLLYRFVFLKL